MNEVFVLVYSHDYGNDVSVHSKEINAWRCAAQIAREWIGELGNEEAEKQFNALMTLTEYRKAAEYYIQQRNIGASSFEDFEVTCCNIDG